MGKVLILCAFALFLLLNSVTFAAKLDEKYTRCAESCMKINPYENTLRNGASHLVKHCAKLTSDGKCECDWEKVLTSTGDCVCRNPGQKVNENNQCVCDLSKCQEPMKECKGTLAIIEEDPNGCCPVYTCEDCPTDSYPSNQTQDETCLCYPCKEPNCKENLTSVVLRKGTLQPGTCCDLYKCEDLRQNKTCQWNGKTYWNGDAWLQDECTMYRCENGIIFHERQDECEDKFNCFSKGNVYAPEQTWLEDECTNCTCVNGRKKCVAHFCEELPSATIKPRMDDCPSLVTCRKTCVFGFKSNRRGCALCKCKQPDVKIMQEILHKINCTVEWCDVLRVLPPNRSAVNDNVSVEQCPRCKEPFSDVSFTIWVLFSVALVTAVLILSTLLYCERRRRDCSMSMHHHKSTSAHPEYKTIPLAKYDANLNTEQPIYKKANHELDDFY